MNNIQRVRKNVTYWYPNTLTNSKAKMQAETSFEIIQKASIEMEERENPQPLTYNQMKEREKKPVFIVKRTGSSYWQIAPKGIKELDFADKYGVEFVAYEHEPRRVERLEFKREREAI